MPEKIEYRTGDQRNPRGLVVEVNTVGDPATGSPACRIVATLPQMWRTITQHTCDDGSTSFIAVGHLYARSAQSFDVGESLDFLGKTYLYGGISAVQNAIGGGLFALVVVDHMRATVSAFCDLLACMPLFYKQRADGVMLATNQFDLQSDSEVCTAACMEYLTYGYLPFSPSLLEGVERLGLGQVLTIDLNDRARLSVSDQSLPAYPPPHERITDVGEACARLDELFTQYFARLGDEPIAAGLSGGYDSRLIAACTADKNRRLVTFGNPGTAEAETAQRVAAVLGTSTELFDIPADAPSRFIDDFRLGMQTLDSLEMSHVFAILDVLLQSKPQYLIDGFLGGEAMGSHYYYKLSGDIEPMLKVLLARDRYRSPRMNTSGYADRLRDLYGRRIDLFGRDSDNDREPFERMAEEQRDICYSDADMVELLSYRLRTRCVIACGPVTFLRRANALCPFYDRDIFETCLTIDKGLRAGDRLYNAFWRYRFPVLADIPKESTGGRPSQGDLAYRMTHFRNALQRRFGKRLPGWIIRSSKGGGDMQDFVTNYCESPENQDIFARAWSEKLKEQLPAHVGAMLPANHDDIMASKYLHLRMASLSAFLHDAQSQDSA